LFSVGNYRIAVGDEVTGLLRESGYVPVGEMSRERDAAWQQLSMFVAPVFEVRLRVGGMPQSDHFQLQIEWVDATSGHLLGMVSRPHCDLDQLGEALTEFTERMRTVVWELAGPFPDL
jgi:hypothetical protein